MTAAVAQTWFMTVRHLRALARQPWWIVVTLVQPIIWLLLYGALFKSIVNIPGFKGDNYIQYLTPGVVVMTAFFSAGWSGMGLIDDIDRGVLDRFLITPVRRVPLIAGRLMQNSVGIAVQSVIIFVLAIITGASFGGGVGGAVLLIALSAVLAFGFGALSTGAALLIRREESVIALMQFLLLPLTFLSSAFMQKDLMPGWIQTASEFNPVNWAVEAGRSATDGTWDWSLIGSRTGFLVAFAIACAWFATRAFKSYQRTV